MIRVQSSVRSLTFLQGWARIANGIVQVVTLGRFTASIGDNLDGRILARLVNTGQCWADEQECCACGRLDDIEGSLELEEDGSGALICRDCDWHTRRDFPARQG